MLEQNGKPWFFVDHALEIIFAFGASGMITYANEAAKQQLEYGEQLCGTYISEVFPNDFQLRWGTFSTDLEFGEALHDAMAYRKNRTCFLAEFRIEQVEENPVLYVCMAWDISKQDFLEKEIVRVAREAEDNNKVRSEFVANVTHELRTPVNGLLGNTQQLLEQERDGSKLKTLQLMERGCRDMNAIINNILDFSKLEAGKFTLEPQLFDFRNMMDYVKSNHISKITEKGLEFFVTISPEVPEHIIGDELRIEQILNNLLSNACKFTSVGKIAVEVVKTAQVGNRAELFFLVLDSGIGLDAADQDKLFKSFSQVDASISRRFGGTGLGLNISKQLVELMGGNIGVESEKNKGSMFSFSIWVEVPEEEQADSTVNIDREIAIGQIHSMHDEEEPEISAQIFGSRKNLKEIGSLMSKLILCVEMENWEKAETFMQIIRELTQDAPAEVRQMALRLKLAVQKENYEKTIASYDNFKSELEAMEEEAYG